MDLDVPCVPDVKGLATWRIPVFDGLRQVFLSLELLDDVGFEHLPDDVLANLALVAFRDVCVRVPVRPRNPHPEL